MRSLKCIGPTPPGESAAQPGSPEYHVLSDLECVVFRRQLQRTKPVPAGIKAAYSIRQLPDDLCPRREVVLTFDDADKSAAAFASDMLEAVPIRWDARAMFELVWLSKREKFYGEVRRGSMLESDVPPQYRDPVIPQPPGETLAELLMTIH
ncbi:MAG: hypothetical protein WC100_20955 [Sterolibacterium sp.]